MTRLFEAQKLDFTVSPIIKSVSQDLSRTNLADYDLVVLYNNADVKSLFENFPDFRQGDIHFISYGKTIVKSMEDAGLQIAIKAPTAECPG